MKIHAFLLVCAVSSAAVSSSSAGLLAYEPFNGYAAGPLPGQAVTAQTQGINTSANITSAGTGANFNTFNTTGLSFSNLIVSGGSGLYSDTSGRPSYIGYSYTGATVTGTLYSSYLVNLVTAPTAVAVASLRANTSSTGSGTSSYFHAYADGFNSVFAGSQYDNNNAATAGSTSLTAGTPYVVIGRFTNVGTALSVGNPGVATTFVLSAAQFDYFKEGGFSDAELDGAPIGIGAANVTARVSDGPVTTGTYNFASGNGIQFGPGNGAANQTVAYDEFRFGTSLNDVLPLVVPPPDPDVAVTLSVPSPLAPEPTAAGGDPGNFTITRAGATTSELRVYLTVSGTATNGIDYPTIPSFVLIPAGSSSVSIPVVGYTDNRVEGNETVVLTITSGAGYLVPPAPSGTVTIVDRPLSVSSSRSRFVQKLAAGLQQRIVVYGTSLTANGAWPGQIKAELDKAWPGQTTLLNKGGSGMASDWGVANLATQVIASSPDVVFIEFSTNDSVARFDISLAQARANLETIISGIHTAFPECEIILQVMNPVVNHPEGADGWRPQLDYYQQIYRDVAAAQGLLVIDHFPAWQAVIDQGNFLNYAADGLHPNAQGYETYALPTMLQAIGVPFGPTPSIIVDNSQATLVGDWPSSSATAGAYGGQYLIDGNAAKGSKSVTYQPEIPTAGTYPVYLRWAALANRATNVPVTVHYAGGSTQVIVNQTINGGIWYKLGDFPLAAGSDNSIVIETTGTDGFVIADAVGIAPPTVSLSISNGRAAEPSAPGENSRPATLTVSRTGPLTSAISVGLQISGTAANGTDYDLLPNSITIPAGAASASLTLNPKYDGVTEGPETAAFTLTPPAGVTNSALASASIAVVDGDDSPFLTWKVGKFSASQLANPAISGQNADPDGDGLTNLMEYFTGLSPLEQNPGAIALGSLSLENVNYPTLTYPHAAGTGLSGSAQVSQDLIQWNSGAAYLTVDAAGDPGTPQTITVRSAASRAAVPRQFLRLGVNP